MAEDAGQLSSAGRVRGSAAQDAAADPTGSADGLLVPSSGESSAPASVSPRSRSDKLEMKPKSSASGRFFRDSATVHSYTQLRATAITEPFFALKWHMSVLNRHIRAQPIA